MICNFFFTVSCLNFSGTMNLFQSYMQSAAAYSCEIGITLHQTWPTSQEIRSEIHTRTTQSLVTLFLIYDKLVPGMEIIIKSDFGLNTSLSNSIVSHYPCKLNNVLKNEFSFLPQCKCHQSNFTSVTAPFHTLRWLHLAPCPRLGNFSHYNYTIVKLWNISLVSHILIYHAIRDIL